MKEKTADGFTFNSTLFPNPKRFFDKIHGQGVKMILSVHMQVRSTHTHSLSLSHTHKLSLSLARSLFRALSLSLSLR